MKQTQLDYINGLKGIGAGIVYLCHFVFAFYYGMYTLEAADCHLPGNLDIVINTPYYLIESSQDFQYNNPGYELHLTGLPEGELIFTLCSEPSPVAPVYSGYIYPFIKIGMIGFILIAGIVISFLSLKKKRKHI